MAGENSVYICGGKFECVSELEAGTPVKVSVDFDDVIITDDEEDGTIGATVVSSIYKGSYYQCIVRTDDYYDFFVDTEDDWLKGDRVGINIDPAKIIIEKREVTEDGEAVPSEQEVPVVVDQTVDPDEEDDDVAEASENVAETVSAEQSATDKEVQE